MPTKRELSSLITLFIEASHSKPKPLFPHSLSMLADVLKIASIEALGPDDAIPAGILKSFLDGFALTLEELATSARFLESPGLDTCLALLKEETSSAAAGTGAEGGASASAGGAGAAAAGAGLFAAATVRAEATAGAHQLWRKQFERLGIAIEEFEKLRSNNAIKNYMNLYKRVRLFIASTGGNTAIYALLNKLTAAGLCVLSGELEAVQMAEDRFGLKWNELLAPIGSSLHVAMLSGNPNLVRKALIEHEAAFYRKVEAEYQSRKAAILAETGLEDSHKAIISAGITREELSYPRCGSGSYFGHSLQDIAALSGDIAILTLALELERGVRVTRHASLTDWLQGYHPEHYAALSGSMPMFLHVRDLMVAHLVPGSPSPLHCSETGVSIAHCAAQGGNTEILETALAMATAPHAYAHACYGAHSPDSIRSQLGWRFPDSSNLPLHAITRTTGANLAHYAALGGTVPALRMVLSLGVKPDARDDRGETLAMWAVRGNAELVLSYVINELHADPFMLSDHGGSLLHIAARMGILGMTLFVLELGLDPEFKVEGLNAYDLARSSKVPGLEDAMRAKVAEMAVSAAASAPAP